MIIFRNKYKTTLTPSEVSSWLESLEEQRIGFFNLRRFKIRKDRHSFSVRVKHSYDENEGPRATAYGNFYRSTDRTNVDLVTKPSTTALVLLPIIIIGVTVHILLFPESISSAEDLASNHFARIVAVCFFLLLMIPIGYLLIFMPMHQIRYFIEQELKLQKIY